MIFARASGVKSSTVRHQFDLGRLSSFVGSTTSIQGSSSHTFAAFIVSQITERVDAADHRHEPVPVHRGSRPVIV